MDLESESSVGSSNSTHQPTLAPQDNLESKESKGSSSSGSGSDPEPGGFGFQAFKDEDKTEDEDDDDEELEIFDEGLKDDEDLEKEEAVEVGEASELEQDEDEAETEIQFKNGDEDKEEEDHREEEEMPMKTIPTNTELPKMRSRFVMSNQQIRDFIDPDNQKDFNDKITKINEMLEDAKKEYCSQFSKTDKPEGTEFKLRKGLLADLVYRDQLDLAGNFLQQIVGRRLNDGDMPALKEFLVIDNTVWRLNLAYNDLTDEGLMILAGILLIRNDILHLNLAHNNVTPEGCQHFVEFLMQRPSLHSLKLSGMKIGEQGFDGLICLIMSGRGPYDLDVSETDMGIGSFQGICTAWQAMDNDEDFPKYLVSHPLPIPLEQLAGYKKANNDYKRKQNNLQFRRSVVKLIEDDPKVEEAVMDGDGDKSVQDSMTEHGSGTTSLTQRQSNGESIQEKVSYDTVSVSKVSSQSTRDDYEEEEESVAAAEEDQVRMVEKISATILEGLFEIPELQAQSYPKTKTLIEGDEGSVEKILEEAKEMPDLDLIIEEYHKIKEAGCVPMEPDGKPVIVCPSLYSLELDDVLQTHTSQRKEGEKTRHFNPSTLDELMDEAAAKSAKEGRSDKVPDDDSANKASMKIVTRAIQEASQFASSTDYEEKSDSAQMLLSIVLDTCQQLIDKEDSKGEFQEQELQAIWDATTEQAMNIIQTRVPPANCTMTQNEVRAFVRKFMESTNRTFLHLLRNPFIPPLLIDVATKACRDSVDQDLTRPTRPVYSTESAENLDPSYVKKIVINFLEGAISEAAHLIGSGDPYHFRRKHEPLPEVLEKAMQNFVQTEGNAQGAMDDFFLAGALLAEDSMQEKQELELYGDTAEEPATNFLEQLFDKVAELIIETDEVSRKVANEPLPRKFPYAAQPSRLVLNRPIFLDFEPVMAGKFAEFIRTNTTLKCLHMRKWNLGEDGMISLNDGLVFNTSIVVLDLGSNAIGGEGAKGLSKFVRQNKNLKHLLLNHNNLRNPGMTYLTQALTESSLEFLNVAYNDITDESLDPLFETLPQTKIKALHAIGNHFSQNTWQLAKELLDSESLTPELCDFTLQEVDGKGMIVKNSQLRDTNEWYDCQPLVADGLYRSPYFEDGSYRNVPLEAN